ncbi:MAG: SMC-Scp complex subunit ScpB [Planctomycetaceae bacterium]|jgi:segregation and condensation protein B|nr:SMC-Scp complex subunit ScpB [Planctomycetaceae bacterium]
MGKGRFSKPVNDSAELFGAASFVETFDEDDGGDEDNILSFEALKEAFAKVNACAEKLDEKFPADVNDINSTLDEEEPEQEYETAETEFDICSSANKYQTSAESLPNLSPRSVIEAILFTGNKENSPIPAERIAEKMRDVQPEEIDGEVAALNEQYGRLQRPYGIIRETGGYRMVLRSEYESVRKNFHAKERRVRLPQQAIDTLSVVAYKQPVTADIVTKMRQEPSLPLLNQLVKRGLLRTEKVTEGKKPVAYYRTTGRFLKLFQLETLADLPMLEDV